MGRWGRIGAALLLAASLAANGGTLRVAERPVGAYRVSVYTDPTPPRPDSVDVSVLVVRADDPLPVDGLDVRVTARYAGPDGAPGFAEGRTLAVQADRAQADDPRYYAAKFAPGIPGEWILEVAVDGPEGSGAVAFRIEVREPGLLDRPGVVVALALLPLVLLAAWLVRGDAAGATRTEEGDAASPGPADDPDPTPPQAG